VPSTAPVAVRLLADPIRFTGVAGQQVDSVVKRVTDVVARFGDEIDFMPAPIL